jgi:site-specific DNA-methyltransferase (adenine-specific)
VEAEEGKLKPYYEHAGIQIYHGDCREILPQLTLADVIVTDPPYGETSLEWDKSVRGWLDACEAVTRNVWCFGSMQMFMEMARVGECSRWKRAQEIVWEKHNGSSSHADRFKRVHEIVVQFYLGDWASIFKTPVFTPDAIARTVRRKARPPHWHGRIEKDTYKSYDGGDRLMRSVIYVRSCHGDAVHPTQKPIGILQPILRYSAQTNVCDPFMGSGSTLVAAKQLGLDAIGIEIEEKNCEIAAKRLSQEVLQF